MKRYKKLIAGMLCISTLVTSLLAGCGGQTEGSSSSSGGNTGSNQTGEPTYQKTITIAPDLDFTGVNVQDENGSFTKSVFLTVMNTLVEYDTTTAEYVPGLAVSWEQISDTEWEFKLREGVTFHDGSEFNAEDVKFTLDRGKTGAQSRAKLTSVESVTVVDPYTIRLTLNAPDEDIIYKLTEPNLCILSKEAFDTMEEDEAMMIGTGPFQYQEWVQGDHVTLVRYDDYWGGALKTEEIIIRNIPEASARLVALQSGEVDYCVNPPAIDLHYIAEDPNLVLHQVMSSNIRYITVNTSVAPFDNELVRQAVAHAINRDDMVIAVYEGNATATNNPMHPLTAGYKEVTGYEYDVEKAKQLLVQAGYPNGFSTEIYCSSGTTQQAVASVLQAQLGEIGINAQIQSLDTATFNAGILPGGSYPLGVMGWGGYFIGPDNAMRSIFYSTGQMNFSNLDDPYIDNLLDEALGETDQDRRNQLYGELQDYVVELATWLPIAIEQTNIGVSADLEGYEDPFGVFHHLRNLYIVE